MKLQTHFHYTIRLAFFSVDFHMHNFSIIHLYNGKLHNQMMELHEDPPYWLPQEDNGKCHASTKSYSLPLL